MTIKLTDIYDVFGELSIINERDEMVPKNYEELKKYDIDFDFGKIGEDFTKTLFEHNTKVEVKTDRGKWKGSGNIAIEIRCKGRDSGLTVTDKDGHFVYLLTDNEEIIGGFIFKVEYLKEKIRQLHKEGRLKMTMGGDGGMSQLVLLPIKELFTT